MRSTPTHQLSVRRSSVRTRVLLILHARGEVHGRYLAELAAIDPRRLSWAMHGYPDRYRRALGLVVAGLVEERRAGRQVRYRLTARGRALAAALLDERAHRERRG
jgi:predicted transcriptional regulator with HTH domain